MILLKNAARNRWAAAILLFITAAFIFAGCHKKSRSEMGSELFEQTQNKVFKNVTPEGYQAVFTKVLAEQKSHLNNPNIIEAFYTQNGNDPVFVMDHLKNHDLQSLDSCLQHSTDHGIDPKIFHAGDYHAILTKLYAKNGIKTVDEAYHDIAELELLTANALINYTNAMEFGLVSPRRIYQRYYTKTLRPDSNSMKQALQTSNIRSFLDSIQPKNPQYVTLQKALKAGVVAPGMTKEQTQRVLVVNLERLRWKNKPSEKHYVIVNIPDYRLDVMDNGQSVLNMKVCVGEGRNKDDSISLAEYDESDKVDRPFDRETPQLNSAIYAAQVNPVWNIPKSIVSKEIIAHIQGDPYYLSNMGIDVYKNGKKVDDPETIDWSSAANDDAYEFKQQPGAKNALGKIKFLFPNKSSVYLHDTPEKSAFDLSKRDVSHGCVRLEKPLDFARVLFGSGSSKFETIQKVLQEDNPSPETLSLSHKVPIYITYVTCWADGSGTVQFRQDVYGLDSVLYGHLQKFLTV